MPTATTKAELEKIVKQTVSKALRSKVAEEARLKNTDWFRKCVAEQESALDLLKSWRFRALGDEDALIVLAHYSMLVMRDAVEAVQRAQARLTSLEKDQGKPRRKPNPKKIKAAWHNLYDALRHGVTMMNRCAIKKPDLFRSFACEKLFWPVIKSPHRGFKESASQEPVLFRRLGIGTKHPFLHIVGAKWRIDDEAGELAIDLWTRVYNSQSPKRGKRKLPDFYQERIGDKPAGWECWWKEAEQLLKAELDNPAQCERLKQIVTAPTKRKSPGRVKAHLLLTIKDRFRSMAGANKTR